MPRSFPPGPSAALLAAALLTVAPCAVPAAAQARPDSVSLRFDWPVGTTARVEQAWSRVQQGPGRADSVVVRSSYRLQVLAHPEGRLVRTDSFALAGATAAAVAGSADAQRVLAQIGTLQPTMVVSAEGEFLRLENAEQTKRFLDSLVAPMRAGIANAPPEARAMLDDATSLPVITAGAAQEWNALVGTWVGAEWAIGDAYETTVDEPLPVLQGLTVPMTYTFAAVGRVPCTEAARDSSCVHLLMHSEPDSAGFRRVMEEMMQRMGANAKDVMSALGGMRMEGEVTLVADPRTLRPYWIERVRSVEARTMENGRESVTTRVDVRSARYRYDR